LREELFGKPLPDGQRQNVFEACLFKMAVVRDGFADLFVSHDDEADAIYNALTLVRPVSKPILLTFGPCFIGVYFSILKFSTYHFP
jgi:hypothetical protein